MRTYRITISLEPIVSPACPMVLTNREEQRIQSIVTGVELGSPEMVCHALKSAGVEMALDYEECDREESKKRQGDERMRLALQTDPTAFLNALLTEEGGDANEIATRFQPTEGKNNE